MAARRSGWHLVGGDVLVPEAAAPRSAEKHDGAQHRPRTLDNAGEQATIGHRGRSGAAHPPGASLSSSFPRSRAVTDRRDQLWSVLHRSLAPSRRRHGPLRSGYGFLRILTGLMAIVYGDRSFQVIRPGAPGGLAGRARFDWPPREPQLGASSRLHRDRLVPGRVGGRDEQLGRHSITASTLPPCSRRTEPSGHEVPPARAGRRGAGWRSTPRSSSGRRVAMLTSSAPSGPA